MKTKIFLLAALLMSGLVLLISACSGALPTATATAPALADTATLSELQGTVQIRNPGQADFSAASNGDTLQVGGQVRTGADGRARLDFASGTILRVAPDSLFTLETNRPANDGLLTRLMMEAGQLWVVLNGGEMEVETPSGMASVRGSFMSVWLDPLTNDAWVTCLEGWCQAENTAGLMDMLAGEGCMLYSFDPEGNVPPPPPQLRYLTQVEIDEFLANNPEAEEIMQAMIATASALPTLVPTSTPTPLGSCFELGLPVDGSEVPGEGAIQFDWYDQPGAYKYVLKIVKPNLAERSWITWRSSALLDAAELPLEGTYSWSVTAYDSSIQPICTSGPWTFTKPASAPPSVDCFDLTAPEDGFELPASGPVTFQWEEYPGRYKYVITITKPDGVEISRIVWTNNYTIQAEMFTLPGTYHWQVTAYDANIKPLCTSESRSFVRTGESLPTPTPGGCVSLLTPANAASLSATGPVTFTWTEHPQAYKYIINFKHPDGSILALVKFGTSDVRYMDALTQGGTYEWWVTVKNSNLNEICSSEHFTFTKPRGTMPTSTPGGGGNVTFWNQIGPTGNIAVCTAFFSVETNAPGGGIVKVIFSTDPVPDGYTDPHRILSHNGGTNYSANICLDGMAAGTTIYWRFAIYQDGVYTHDENIYSFVSPGCPSTPPDTPTTFQNGSGPSGTSDVCTNHFQVDAIDPEGLRYVKVSYKVLDGGGNLVLQEYQRLTHQGGDTWAGDLYIAMQPNYNVVWWFWAIDNNGNHSYSDTQSFTYTGSNACP